MKLELQDPRNAFTPIKVLICLYLAKIEPAKLVWKHCRKVQTLVNSGRVHI